jgi:hypothetical protein
MMLKIVKVISWQSVKFILLHCCTGKHHHHGTNHKATKFDQTPSNIATRATPGKKKQTLTVMTLHGMTCVILVSSMVLVVVGIRLFVSATLFGGVKRGSILIRVFWIKLSSVWSTIQWTNGF